MKKGTIFADVPPWPDFSTLTERGKGCNNISRPVLGWYLFSQTPVSENTLGDKLDVCIKKARMKKVHATTAKIALVCVGIAVAKV